MSISPGLNPNVNAVANRLRLRQPQRDSLEILARVAEILPMDKHQDMADCLEKIKAEFGHVTDFERDFPSLCFALATGVGKTRLMGAFIAYLHRAEGIRHFFVLAPNLTIYNKLIADFTNRHSPKYVFQGIAEFATTPPEIITGDNYESGRGVRSEPEAPPSGAAADGQASGGGFALRGQTAVRQGRLFGQLLNAPIHINIFNISKINAEVRGGNEAKVKRLSEYIGESYFEYLSKLDDLVMLMDESHRYRASAGVRAINELRPILGLELTATPQVETGGNSVAFKNVIYSYPLSAALKDGFVKEPAVVTRENFDPKNYGAKELERLKLEDGIRVHENTKVELEVYARENGQKIVKPFMLVVAQDTTHAGAIQQSLEEETFLGGRYKGKVITVHSNLRGEEKDETVQQLLSVEDPTNPTEIVVHVNMLKEGWDVTNLYTIVPLRAANSRTLVEQSIGRGLRLPYGKRVGVEAVDTLSIVSHDKFQEIVDYARNPDSIIKRGIVIGRDIPEERMRVEVVQPMALARLIGAPPSPVGTPSSAKAEQQPLFTTPKSQEVAVKAWEVIQREYERLPSSGDLTKPEVRAKIVERVQELVMPAQGELEGVTEKVDVGKVVDQVIKLRNELTIDIPKIVVVPKGEVVGQYRPFEMDTRNINYPPVDHAILTQYLTDQRERRLVSGDGVVREDRLENYLVSGLIDFDDISYDEHADLLYALASQVVKRLQSYLPDEDDVHNVLRFHQQALVHLIHTQMQEHYEEQVTDYEAKVTKGFTTLRPKAPSIRDDDTARDFRQPVEDLSRIRQMLFTGWSKGLYSSDKFDSDPERRFAVIVDKTPEAQKWFRPSRGDFRIYHTPDEEYVPDFAVETTLAKFVCEVKAKDEIETAEVQSKARAAAQWCEHATAHEKAIGGKPWTYLLIPHDAVDENKTFAAIAARFTWVPPGGHQNRQQTER